MVAAQPVPVEQTYPALRTLPDCRHTWTSNPDPPHSDSAFCTSCHLVTRYNRATHIHEFRCDGLAFRAFHWLARPLTPVFIPELAVLHHLCAECRARKETS